MWVYAFDLMQAKSLTVKGNGDVYNVRILDDVRKPEVHYLIASKNQRKDPFVVEFIYHGKSVHKPLKSSQNANGISYVLGAPILLVRYKSGSFL